MPDAICRPFVSASRDHQPLGSVWQLECEHDLHVVGAFPQLVALADQHVAGQCPPPAGMFDRILAAVRAVS